MALCVMFVYAMRLELNNEGTFFAIKFALVKASPFLPSHLPKLICYPVQS